MAKSYQYEETDVGIVYGCFTWWLGLLPTVGDYIHQYITTEDM